MWKGNDLKDMLDLAYKTRSRVSMNYKTQKQWFDMQGNELDKQIQCVACEDDKISESIPHQYYGNQVCRDCFGDFNKWLFEQYLKHLGSRIEFK